MEEEEEIVQLKIYSSKGEMMYKQGEDVAELYATELDKMRDMKFTRPVKLPCKSYFQLNVIVELCVLHGLTKCLEMTLAESSSNL